MPKILLSKVIERIQECGCKDFELINLKTTKTVLLPVFCNSRACDNPECQEHRGGLFKRKHLGQISAIQSSMQKPKAWVFTGYVIKQDSPTLRAFICEKTALLYQILKRLSSSEFSLHVEVKPSKKYKDCFYVHWHVVCGGLKDYHYAQTLWGRYVEYQKAKNIDSVAEYVAKYATKTPVHVGDSSWLNYLMVTYKLRLHRFSTVQGEITKSDWTPVLKIISEGKRALAHHRKRNDWGVPTDYIPYLDDRPPDVESEFSPCIKIYQPITKSLDEIYKGDREKKKERDKERSKEKVSQNTINPLMCYPTKKIADGQTRLFPVEEKTKTYSCWNCGKTIKYWDGKYLEIPPDLPTLSRTKICEHCGEVCYG